MTHPTLDDVLAIVKNIVYPEQFERIKVACMFLDNPAQITEQSAEKAVLAKVQPCGCVVCTCEDSERCHGCGAKNCGTHPPGEFPNPLYKPLPAAQGAGEAEPVDDVAELAHHIEGVFGDAPSNDFMANLLNALDRAGYAPKRRPPASAWQPIESAPKDGSVVWLFDGTGFAGKWDVIDSEWRPVMPSRPIDGAWHIFANARNITPTHWCPLPPPPAKGETP